MKKNYSKAFFAAIAALGLATTAAAQPTYHVTEIPSAPGAACIGTAINDAGVVAGSCLPVNGLAASAANRGIAIWRNGVPTIITDATGEAVDINAAGYVVGWMSVGGESHGFVWHADRGLWDLGPGQARNIDELGTIAGCRGVDDESRATLWQARMTAAEASTVAPSEAASCNAPVRKSACRCVSAANRIRRPAFPAASLRARRSREASTASAEPSPKSRR